MQTEQVIQSCKIDLAGPWNYRLDPNDAGVTEQWYQAALPQNGFNLPGTTSENRLGEPLAFEPVISKEAVERLRERYKYIGAAWYQKQIVIPSEWINKRIVLFLERVMFQSEVWIDGHKIGSQDSLSTPHVFDLTEFAKPGTEQTLTFRIDNRDIHNISTYPSAYTEQTQTIWNGVIGKMELRASDKVFLHEVQVYPDVNGKKIRVTVSLGNLTAAFVDADLTVQARSRNTGTIHEAAPAGYRFPLQSRRQTFEFEYLLGEGALLWDEFSPAVYSLELQVSATAAGIDYTDRHSTAFGMRQFLAEGSQFSVNGRKTFLRGTLDCCIYPLTGYPPMEKDAWEKVFRTVKDYGLNHVRFHSWCPPEAAFAAADDIGVYVQVEGPAWLDTWATPVGKYPEHYTYLPDEAIRIVDKYGNHPSFCLFSNGNELRGDFKLLHDIIEMLKKRDTRMVFTLTSNWDRPIDPADDFFIAQTVDGVGVRGQYDLDRMAETTELDFHEAIPLRNVPIVSHEIGQYSVYPNMAEISKYTGILRPVNFEAIRNDLIEKNMFDQAERFSSGSGMLALQLYKDEIEAALRTSGFGGFQLLDLHDFPGQSTATVGILDSFWESKGLVTPERFRGFCSPTVPLLRMVKRLYKNSDVYTASVEMAHFGPEELVEAVLKWEIADPLGAVVAEGVFPAMSVPIGNGIAVGSIDHVRLDHIQQASRMIVTVSLEGEPVSNSWDIWVYPEHRSMERFSDGAITIASSFSHEVEERLAEGASVLLLPEAAEWKQSRPGKFFPVFWSPVHFTSQDPCGIYCDSDHPVFADFPTDFYASYQWKDLLERSVSVCLDELPVEFLPIVQVIPNFFHNSRLGNLFEAKVGNGKLFVCSIDIGNDLDNRVAARQLRRSILSYMGSDRFAPVASLTIDQLKSLFQAAQ